MLLYSIQFINSWQVVLLKSQFELVVLGSGAGASSVYGGLASSSFMLCYQGEPFCLVDLGLGVGREVINRYSKFPDKVVITHNHSDHAGDLAVVLRVELAREHKMQVISHNVVAERLKNNRIAEHHEQLSPNQLADWIALKDDESYAIGHGLTIEFYPGVHSETCYGFVLRDKDGVALLSYTGDSTLHQSLYETLSKAVVFIMDARPKPNKWHANFAEVKPWLKEGCFILGHGLSTDNIAESFSDLPLLVTGQSLEF